MGTSKSFGGLSPQQSLLPPWAQGGGEPDQPEGDENGNQDAQPDDGEQQHPIDRILEPLQGDWGQAKGALTRLINGERNDRPRKISRSAKKYVRGSGGSSAMKTSAYYGRSSAVKLGGFLSTISEEGVSNSFLSFNLGSLSGLSVEMAFNKIAEVLCSPGATSEEAIANQAIVEVLSKMYEEFELGDNDLSDLDSLDNGQIKHYLELYVSTYIYERWLHELGIQIEKNPNLSTREIVELESEIKEWISAQVHNIIADEDVTTNNFLSDRGQQIIDEVFEDAYQMIEND